MPVNLDRHGLIDAAVETLEEHAHLPDIIVQLRVGSDRTAAVWQADGRLFATYAVTPDPVGIGLTQSIQDVGGGILAGVAPAGTVRTLVRYPDNGWQDAVVGEGAWICRTTVAPRDELPQVRFLDRAGLVIGA
jgi:signal transduction histidine kinase